MSDTLFDKAPELINSQPFGSVSPAIGSLQKAQYATNSAACIVHQIPLHLLEAFSGGMALSEIFKDLDQIRSLSHYNMLPLEHFWHDETSLFFVYQGIQGTLLAESSLSHRFNAKQAISMTISIASILNQLHQRGVVHGNLNPGSIIIGENDRILLFQSGFSHLIPKLIDGRKFPLEFTAYLYPAAFDGEPAKPTDDIFSLGLLLFRLLTRTNPFMGDTWRQIEENVKSAAPHPLRVYDMTLPSDLDFIIRKSLSKQREERFQSCSEFIGELKNLRLSGSIVDRRDAIKNVIVKRPAFQSHDTVHSGVQDEESESEDLPIPDEVKKELEKAIRKTIETHHTPIQQNGSPALEEETDDEDEEVENFPLQRHWLSFWSVVSLIGVLLLLVVLKTFGVFPFNSKRNTRGILDSDQSRELFIKKKINDLFLDAQRLYGKGQFCLPAGNNAWETYKKILKLDSENGIAKRRIASMKQMLEENVEQNIASEDYKEAAVFVRHLQVMTTDDAKVEEYIALLKEKGVQVESVEKLLAERPSEGETAVKTGFYSTTRAAPLKGVIVYGVRTGHRSTVHSYSLENRKKDTVQYWKAKGVFHRAPYYSSDGKWAVYASASKGNGVIHLVDVASGKDTILTKDQFDNRSPCITSDGKTVVFASYRLAQWDLYRLEVSTKKVTQLTFDSNRDDYPSFTADGNAVVFQTKRTYGWEIAKMQVTGGSVELLTRNRADDLHPTLSPDGKWIVYQSNANINWDIILMNSRGAKMRVLAGTLAVETHPCFSPDSSQVLYIEEKGEAGTLVAFDLHKWRSKRLVSLLRKPEWLSWRLHVP